MLKIKKTKLPYHKSYIYYICILTLICGIIPSLAPLSKSPVSAASLKTLSDISTMQEITPAICGNSKPLESKVLRDVRDNKSYTVTKLKDGNCWMTDNLALALYDEENNQPATLTPETSNISADWQSTTGPSALWQKPVCSLDTPEDCDIVKYYNGSESDHWQEEYGYYYSWAAATAGEAAMIEKFGEATQDICPRGWKIPAISQYDTLVYSAGATSDITAADRLQIMLNAPYNFLINYYVDGNLYDKKDLGRYWTNTAFSESQASALRLDRDIEDPVYTATNYRFYGFGIRCMADGNGVKDSTVSVTVPKVLSIDAISDNLVLEADPNKITTGNISATISANTTYSVQLSANKTSLTNSASSDEPTPTNSIPTSSNVIPKTNAWGILNSDNTTYSAITTTPTTYYNAEEYNEAEQSTKHTFAVGVSISPTLPAGEYSTTVTITAVNN